MSFKENTVIVRGMKQEWFINHFKDMEIYFGGDPRGIPAYDTDYIGFYLEAPDSAITHIGIVSDIDRYKNGATFYLKAIIKLDEPIKVDDHAIRKQEYWTLKELGINNIVISINSFFKINKT
jgi:hypothetical protein